LFQYGKGIVYLHDQLGGDDLVGERDPEIGLLSECLEKAV
jgi:hypothetical protein